MPGELIKNDIAAQKGNLEAFEHGLKRVNLALANERRMAFGSPMQRIAQDEEKRHRLLATIWCAANPNLPLPEKFRTTLGEDSTPGSTYIDDVLERDIYDTLGTYGIWNTFDARMTVTKDTKIPVKTARAAANFLLTEGGAITEDTTKAGSTVTTTLELIAALLPVSLQLMQDDEVGVTQDVLGDFAEALAYKLDWACLQADGTADATDGGMTGVFSGGTAATADTAGTDCTVETLELADVVRCLTTVDAGILSRPCRWWLHPQILVRMLSILDSNGRPIFLTANEAPTPAGIGSILGYPVTLAHAAPTTNTAGSAVAVFGDPNGLAVRLRNDFEFAQSDHAGFTTYERYFRGTVRAGVKIKVATAFAVLTLAASS